MSEAPASTASRRARPLGPLWARVVLTLALAPLAAREVHTFVPGPAAEATQLLALAGILLAVATIGTLAWPDVRAGRIVLTWAALLLPLRLGAWAQSVSDVTAVAAGALPGGAAFASFRREGDPAGPTISRRAALAIGGAAVTAAGVLAAYHAAVRAPAAVAPVLGRIGFTSVEVFAAIEMACLLLGLLLGLEAGARVARRMSVAAALASLAAAYVALFAGEGDLRTAAEVRVDTGEARFRYLAIPVWIEGPRLSGAERERLLALEAGAPVFAPGWHAVGGRNGIVIDGAPDRILARYAVARRWLDVDATIARFALEDLASWVLLGQGEGDSPDTDLWFIGDPLEGWLRSTKVLAYCWLRNYDPATRSPAVAPGATHDELVEQLGSTRPALRAAAARRLGERQESAGGALVEALYDDRPEVRAAAAFALGEADGDGVYLDLDVRLFTARLSAQQDVPFDWRYGIAVRAIDDAIRRRESRKTP